MINQDQWETKDFLRQIKDLYHQEKEAWAYYKQLGEIIQFAFLTYQSGGNIKMDWMDLHSSLHGDLMR